MFEGYGSYVAERDQDRPMTAGDLEYLAARKEYIEERALALRIEELRGAIEARGGRP